VFAPLHIALGSALAIAAMAAGFDSRSGTIPNWLTLPPILLAPPIYGFVFNVALGVQCLACALGNGLVPYLLFRRGAVGGGDVKLFAALGAVTAFDPLAGLRIQLGACAAALIISVVALAWRGRLADVLASVGAYSLNRVLPARYQLHVEADPSAPVRMGPSVLVATTGYVLHLSTVLRSAA